MASFIFLLCVNVFTGDKSFDFDMSNTACDDGDTKELEEDYSKLELFAPKACELKKKELYFIYAEKRRSDWCPMN